MPCLKRVPRLPLDWFSGVVDGPHPADAIEAEAYGVFDGVQVGYANFAGNPHVGSGRALPRRGKTFTHRCLLEYDFICAEHLERCEPHVRCGLGSGRIDRPITALLWTSIPPTMTGMEP